MSRTTICVSGDRCEPGFWPECFEACFQGFISTGRCVPLCCLSWSMCGSIMRNQLEACLFDPLEVR